MDKDISFKNLLVHFWRENIVILVILVIIGGSQASSSFITGEMVNQIIDSNLKGFLKGAVICFLIYGIFLLFTYLSIIGRSKVSEKMQTYLREFIMNRLAASSYQTYKQKTAGTYASWLKNDVSTIASQSIEPFYQATQFILQGTISLMSLYFIHGSLFLLAVIFIFILICLPKLFSQALQKASLGSASQDEVFLSESTDLLSAYDTVTAYQQFPYILNKIKHLSKNLGKSKINFNRIVGYVSVSGGFINIASQLSLLILTGYLVFKGEISVGMIAATSGLSSMIFNAFGNISQIIAQVNSTGPLFEKFNQVPERNERYKSVEMINGYQLTNLSYQLQGQTILKPIDYTFEQGKKYAIIGPSGSGKSTLLNILSGRYTDYMGSAKISGQEIKECDFYDLASDVLYIDQNPYLFKASIKENLEIGDHYSEDAIWTALKRAGIADEIARLPGQLEYKLGDEGQKLSGGQMQRLSLARGFLRDKKIILLDEVTSALDQTNAENIISGLLLEPDLLVIMITHHLNEKIEKKLDDILTLK